MSSPLWPGWLFGSDNGLLHKLQGKKEGESDGGRHLISMECAWPMTTLGVCRGRDLFMFSWTVDKRLTVSKELSVLFVLIGPYSVDDDMDSIDLEADAAIDVVLSKVSLDMIPRLINIWTCMHIFLALFCFAFTNKCFAVLGTLSEGIFLHLHMAIPSRIIWWDMSKDTEH